MTRESHLELKVGSFVLAGVLVLSFFVSSISNFSFVDKGWPMQAVFTFANGIKDAAPVRLAGIEVGIVKGIKVYTDEQDKRIKVRINLWIKEGINIPVDSKVIINQLGLLGEKYVEIFPGVSTEYVKVNTDILGKDPVPVERVTEQVNELADKISLTIDKVNSDLLSPANRDAVAGALKGINELIAKVNRGEGTVGRLFNDDSIYRNLEELTADLKLNPWKLLYRPRNIK